MFPGNIGKLSLGDAGVDLRWGCKKCVRCGTEGEEQTEPHTRALPPKLPLWALIETRHNTSYPCDVSCDQGATNPFTSRREVAPPRACHALHADRHFSDTRLSLDPGTCAFTAGKRDTFHSICNRLASGTLSFQHAHKEPSAALQPAGGLSPSERPGKPRTHSHTHYPPRVIGYAWSHYIAPGKVCAQPCTASP
jgi:hypothetical protein